jgi:glycosyltransferase involved in cell wall biosynthesis
MNWIPALAAVLTGRRLVWHLNDMTTPRSVVRILRPIVKAWSWRLAVSAERLTDYYFGNDQVARKKVVVLFPPVDTDKFDLRNVDPGAVLRFRSEHHLEGKGPVIAAIGNPNPAKGYEYLIESASRIRIQYPDSIVLIVGDHLDSQKEYIRRLRQQMERLALESQVNFLGFMDDVRLVLSASDVLVVSSVNEAGPMVALEAMAMERPVITTDVGVVRQAIVDGQSGRIVPPRRPDLLAEGVLTVLAMSPEQKSRMTAVARERVLKLFDIRRVLDDYLKLYKAEVN